MPVAGRKRVEGGLPILSQSVAIGRNRSRLVAIGRVSASRSRRNRRQGAEKVAFRRTGRNRSRRNRRQGAEKVAIGRNRSRRNRRQGAEKVAFRRTGRDWSRLVAIGRNRSRLVAPKQKTRRRKSRDWSQSVAPKQKTRRKHKKSPIPQSGIGLHNVARRRALLTFNELLAQIHMPALEAFS